MDTINQHPMMQFQVNTYNGVRQLFTPGGPYGWKYLATLPR